MGKDVATPKHHYGRVRVGNACSRFDCRSGPEIPHASMPRWTSSALLVAGAPRRCTVRPRNHIWTYTKSVMVPTPLANAAHGGEQARKSHSLPTQLPSPPVPVVRCS